MPSDHTPDATPTHPAGTPEAPRFRVPLPESINGNRRPARRITHHANAIVAALGRQPTAVESSQVVVAALLACQVEELAAKSAGGQEVSPDATARISGALARALDRLGIGAGSKPAEEPAPDELARILEQRKAAGREAAA